MLVAGDCWMLINRVIVAVTLMLTYFGHLSSPKSSYVFTANLFETHMKFCSVFSTTMLCHSHRYKFFHIT